MAMVKYTRAAEKACRLVSSVNASGNKIIDRLGNKVLLKEQAILLKKYTNCTYSIPMNQFRISEKSSKKYTRNMKGLLLSMVGLWSWYRYAKTANYRSIPIHLKIIMSALKKSVTGFSEKLAKLKHTKNVQCTTATASTPISSNVTDLHK